MSRRIFLKNNWKTIKKQKASDPNISSPFAFCFSIPKYAREVAGDKFSVLPCSFIIFYFLSSTIAILIILLTVLFSDTFVDGIPSVNTTISPASASCFAQIRSIALSQISSVVYTATDFSGLTPQLICILLSVASSGLIPIIPVFGLNLDTTLAVAPDTVGVTIHFARRLFAVVTVACASALDALLSLCSPAFLRIIS